MSPTPALRAAGRQAWQTCLREAEERLLQAGIDTASAEIRWMAELVWGRGYGECLMNPPELDDASRDRLETLVGERLRGRPLQYLLGSTWFYDRSWRVAEGVFIPRPETEVLVDRALERLPHGVPLRVLELCCGTGVAGLSVALARPLAELVLSDLNPKAVEVARENARACGAAARTKIVEADLWAGLSGEAPFDLVLCNPPYLTRAEYETAQPEVRNHEPELALVSGRDGLDFYRRMMPGLKGFLRPGGHFWGEIGGGHQVEPLRALAQAQGVFTPLRVYRDLNGRDRGVAFDRMEKTAGPAGLPGPRA